MVKPLLLQPTGKIMPNGEKTFTVTDEKGKEILLFQRNGEYYHANTYRNTNPSHYPIKNPNTYSHKNSHPVNSSKVGDVIRTPDSHPKDFISKGKNKMNIHTKELWQKSSTILIRLANGKLA